MPYSIVQVPFDSSKMEKLSKKDLIAYRDWFHAVMPERLVELTKTVKSSLGFKDWAADFTPESLAPLGEWFRGQVETRKQSKEEILEIKAQLPFPIDVSDKELTARTFSLTIDIGMYFGEVVIRNVPGTTWDQIITDKRFVDYGLPVITGFQKIILNPVRIARTTAYAFADKERTGDALLEIYKFWKKKA